MNMDPKKAVRGLSPTESVGWALLATGSALAVGMVLRQSLAKGWTTATGKEAPPNPATPTVSWGEAATWAVVSGVVVGLGRLCARRGVTALWQNHRPRTLAGKRF